MDDSQTAEESCVLWREKHSREIPLLKRTVRAVAAREREHPTHGATQVRRKVAGPALGTAAIPSGKRGGTVECPRDSGGRGHALEDHTQYM